jgi:hypothetical protein
MRVFGPKVSSTRFLADGSRWVADRGKALNFVTSVMALDAATRMRLDNIEIVLDFDGQGRDVVLNVPEDAQP